MPNTVELTPQAKKTIKETEALVKTYKEFSIASAEKYAEAAECLKAIKTKCKELDSLRRSMTSPLDTAKKQARTRRLRPCANRRKK